MPRKVLIFSKDTCPYTTAAREDYFKRGFDVEYINVKENPEALKKMSLYSGEADRIPVIVEQTLDGVKVLTGFGGT